MKIAGFLPLTLSDYPGCCAAMVFTRGCNWRCPFCHNARLWDDTTESTDQEWVLSKLQQRQRLLDGVVVSGGEPTLQPDLPDFLRQLKTMGLRVKLDTNGSHPNVLQQLLSEDLVDFVAMDIKAPWFRYSELAGVAVDVAALKISVQHIVAWGGGHQFRTTYIPDLLTETDLHHIRRALPVNAIYQTQPFIPELAADALLRRAG
ncbi:anaerobic ribonucleoside-triphosphate reductase activating protein [Planctomycetota bacterium]